MCIRDSSKCSNQSQSSSKSQTQRKLASLKAEEEVLLQIQEAKKEELECRVRLEAAKMESERRRLQKKIREAQIEDDVHTTEGTTAHKLNAAGLTVKSSVLASQTRVSGKPSDIKGSTLNESSEMIDVMLKLLDVQTAPEVDIDIFLGDPLQYNYFRASFRDVVERLSLIHI